MARALPPNYLYAEDDVFFEEIAWWETTDPAEWAAWASAKAAQWVAVADKNIEDVQEDLDDLLDQVREMQGWIAEFTAIRQGWERLSTHPHVPAGKRRRVYWRLIDESGDMTVERGLCESRQGTDGTPHFGTPDTSLCCDHED